MSKIWSGIIILSITISFFTQSTQEVVEIITNSSIKSVENILVIAGTTCFWAGMFNIFSKTKFIKNISQILKPIINKAFRSSLNDAELETVSLNITSNLIGVGNAATVYAVKAMEEMQKSNSNKKKASKKMSLFVLINTASIQLIPTSIVSYRMIYNSKNPNLVVLPNLVISFVSLIAGVLVYSLIERE